VWQAVLLLLLPWAILWWCWRCRLLLVRQGWLLLLLLLLHGVC
jgi:hypothetical protein